LLRIQILQHIITSTETLKGINKYLTLKDFREGYEMNIRYLSDWVWHTGYIYLAQRKYRKYEDIYIEELPCEEEVFEGDE
jgi:hypothetical protein